jgi:hypothetical protein
LRPLARLAFALLLVPLGGCVWATATASFGPRLEPATLARIVPHETTKAEVLELLGPPEEFLRSEIVDSMADEETRIAGALALGNRAHDVFTYQHDWIDARGHFLVLWNRADARVESDLLVVFFDSQDRVREISFRPAERAR